MPTDAPPTPTPTPELLKPAEVMTLLRIGRTTLHEWRTKGILTATRPHARGWWLYPANQPVICAAQAAAGGPR